MGFHLFFVSALNPNGEQPAEDAKWLDPNIKTTYLLQFEEKADRLGLRWDYPHNQRVTIIAMALYVKYLMLLRDLWPLDENGVHWKEPDLFLDFLTTHSEQFEKETWYWHAPGCRRYC